MKKNHLRFLISSIIIAAALTVVAVAFALPASAMTYMEIYDGLEYYYEIDENNEAMITRIEGTIPQEVTVPATLGEYPVKTIGNEVFRYADTLKSVIISEGIKTIGYHAFHFCENLESVTIPASVDHMVDSAFFQCNSIKAIYITDLAAWCSINFESNSSNPLSVAKALYLNGEPVTELEIPENVTRIGQYAFQGAECITSANIHNGVTEIGYCAFDGCNNIESITVPFIGTTKDLNGTESNCFQYIMCAGALDFPQSLKTVVVTGGAIVPDNAFDYCQTIENIVLPEGIITIGEGAFRDCTALKSINIPTSVKSISDSAFLNCSALDGVILPDGLEAIGGGAFANSGITSISIPDSVTDYGGNAFQHCTRLEQIQLPNTMTSIDNYYFTECSSLKSIVIPDSVTSIGQGVFIGCSSLESITLPFLGELKEPTQDSATHFGHIFDDSDILYFGNNYVPESLKTIILTGGNEIDDNAFNGLGYVENIVLPDSIKSIGDSAFSGCGALKELIIPESVESIGECAFTNCGATNIVLPSNLASLGQHAFTECNSLKYVIYENGKYIGDKNGAPVVLIEAIDKSVAAFTVHENTRMIEHNAFFDCVNLESAALPNGVIQIGECAFYNCRSLYSITIPASVTSLGASAFRNCSSLESVTFAEGIKLEHLMQSVFENCTLLKTVQLPESLLSIEQCAFYGSGIVDIVIPSNVQYIGIEAFTNCSSIQSITVPPSVTAIGNNGIPFYYNPLVKCHEGSYAQEHALDNTRIMLVHFNGDDYICDVCGFESEPEPETTEPETVTETEPTETEVTETVTETEPTETEVTETVTETETETESASRTEEKTEEKTEAKTDPYKPENEDTQPTHTNKTSGCSSFLSGTAIAIVSISALGSAIVFRKKED